MFGELNRDSNNPLVLKNFEKVQFGKLSKVANLFYRIDNFADSVLDLSNLDVSNCTSFKYIFYGCKGLKEIYLTGWDMSKCTETDLRWFDSGDKELEILDMTGAKLPDINLSRLFFGNPVPKLTVDSLVSILNALPNSTKGNTLNIGSTNLAKLTDDQKAIATSKGWVLT